MIWNSRLADATSLLLWLFCSSAPAVCKREFLKHGLVSDKRQFLKIIKK
jgi:hypothetical protein